MKKIFKASCLLLIASLMLAGCARMPTAKRSAHLIKHHFKKYAKKYPATSYGKAGVKEVEITGQQEIHKHYVAVESFVTLGDGSVQRVDATLEKGPLGWRFVSWENESSGMEQ